MRYSNGLEFGVKIYSYLKKLEKVTRGREDGAAGWGGCRAAMPR